MPQDFGSTRSSISDSDRKAKLRSQVTKMFGPVPIAYGESREAYDKLYEAVLDFIDPDDIFEAMQVRDLVDIDWEIMRLRIVQSKLIELRTPRVGGQIFYESNGAGRDPHLLPILVEKNYERMIRDDVAGNPAAKAEVDRILKECGLSRLALAAASFADQIDVLDRVQKLQQKLERRRDDRLREIERHRFAKSQKLRPRPRGPVTDLDPSAVVS